MVESNWFKNRLLNTNESTLEWIGTLFFIAGYLFIIFLYNTLIDLETSVLAPIVFFVMLAFGFIYSLFLFASLGSFTRPDNPSSIYDEIESSERLARHPRLKLVIKYFVGGIAMLILINASVQTIMLIYNTLLISAQISDIVIAILIAILIEHFFQLLGLGFKNMIKYQTIEESQITQDE